MSVSQCKNTNLTSRHEYEQRPGVTLLAPCLASPPKDPTLGCCRCTRFAYQMLTSFDPRPNAEDMRDTPPGSCPVIRSALFSRLHPGDSFPLAPYVLELCVALAIA
ncbi:hypothetical protein LIA77_11003 [Sarocladium implicatum]|nr:hypothetical protein LIA77_11003 [Sarocladium implicatum]